MSVDNNKCPHCAKELVETNALTAKAGWVRKTVECPDDNCNSYSKVEDIRMCCECGNKTFVTSKVTANDKEADKHLGKTIILCSDVIECGKTVAYID